ncbi:hypothetical protein [Streptomyces sp. NPDC048002]|uniref:hypothetical protein n=1 Tax=Streptomyces sp. NPDC048002 TaxID=3154344 RepID=UPI0033E91D79
MHRDGTTPSRRTRTATAAAVTAAAVTALVWSAPWADGTAVAGAAAPATAVAGTPLSAEPRLAELRRRFQALPEELRDDLRELRGLSAAERRERAGEIRDKALSGAYGEGVRRWAERRADFWHAD